MTAPPPGPAGSAGESSGGEEKPRSFIGGTPGGKQYKMVVLPTPEQLAQEDFMNNCMVRGTISLVMGGAMGVAFGLFMGGLRDSMDPVSLVPLHDLRLFSCPSCHLDSGFSRTERRRVCHPSLHCT